MASFVRWPAHRARVARPRPRSAGGRESHPRPWRRPRRRPRPGAVPFRSVQFRSLE